MHIINAEEEGSLSKHYPIYRSGIGQDSHRFISEESSKPCIIGGVIFDDVPGLDADSDGDVIFHSICNAITSLTGVPILGGIARELCLKDGITDSQIYLEAALKSLNKQKIVHVAISIEGKKPFFQNRMEELRNNISKVMHINVNQVGITATTGDGLTDFGCGQGVQSFCIISTVEI